MAALSHHAPARPRQEERVALLQIDELSRLEYPTNTASGRQHVENDAVIGVGHGRSPRSGSDRNGAGQHAGQTNGAQRLNKWLSAPQQIRIADQRLGFI